MTLADKLNPDRFTDMSGKMAAIVAYTLCESWTDPLILAPSVTSDAFVTTRSDFMGQVADLGRSLFLAAAPSSDERAGFERRYRDRVDDWRPVLSGPAATTDQLTCTNFTAPGIAV